MQTLAPYQPKHKLRVVTATSLFDGHDASINIMRRIIQASGAEVIHLGHDRSASEVVNTAIQEDANAIALARCFPATTGTRCDDRLDQHSRYVRGRTPVGRSADVEICKGSSIFNNSRQDLII
jgi:hypothetical protein